MAEDRAEYHTGGTSQPDTESRDNLRTLPARGFAQVDNSYFDRLIGIVSPTAYYCLMYLVRRTIGYHTDSVKATLDDLQAATQLSRHTVLKALDDLKRMRILGSDESERKRTQVRAFTLLPVEGWRLDTATPSQTSAKNALVETKHDDHLVQKMHQTRAKSALVEAKTSAKNAPLLNTKRNTSPKYNTDANASCPTPDGADAAPAVPPSGPVKPAKALPEDSDAVQLAAYLRDRILAHSPNARDAKAALQAAKLQQWARPIDLMLRLDGRTPDGIRAVIDFATTDTFWQPNILSPGKLRDQYDRLEGQMRRRKTTVPPARAAPYRPQAEPPVMRRNRDRPLNAKPAVLD